MTQNEPLFSERDKRLIDALIYDPSLKPKFNDLADYFIWLDELPSNFSIEGEDKLESLWVGRSLLHKGLTFAHHPINPEYCATMWNRALEEIPNWPGFKRLKLNEKDNELFQKCLAKVNRW
ncbi:hypothetical protein KA183_09370 [bacterium]|nr:hypothetical protein [bacterium]QQR56500.1 MAG: hypothetical protein IPG59_16005 [Candidatus Melainabacteria bacterium]